MTRPTVHHHKPRAQRGPDRKVSEHPEFVRIEHLCSAPRCYNTTVRYVPIHLAPRERTKLKVCCECLAAHFGGRAT